MKNLKVFVEVKKICTIFLRNKTPFAARQLSVYRRTRNRVLCCFLKKLVYFFCFMMGRAGQGPPNMYVLVLYTVPIRFIQQLKNIQPSLMLQVCVSLPWLELRSGWQTHQGKYLIKTKNQFRIKVDIDWRIQNLHSSYFCLFKNYN